MRRSLCALKVSRLFWGKNWPPSGLITFLTLTLMRPHRCHLPTMYVSFFRFLCCKQCLQLIVIIIGFTRQRRPSTSSFAIKRWHYCANGALTRRFIISVQITNFVLYITYINKYIILYCLWNTIEWNACSAADGPDAAAGTNRSTQQFVAVRQPFQNNRS